MPTDASYVPESAMAIMAHPDDIEFMCAGTLARWAKGGCRLVYVLLTSGDAGIADPAITRAHAAEIRESEAREAARVLGAKEVVFLHEPDGLLVPTLGVRKKLVREIRKYRPEAVVCGDPPGVWVGDDYINHPDHRAAAQAAVDAVYPAAGQPHVYEELSLEELRPHKPRKLFATGRHQDGLFVPIDDTIDVKLAALRQHKSQLNGFDPEPMIRKWAADLAKGKGMKYAEAFHVVTLVDDETWARTKGAVFPERTP